MRYMVLATDYDGTIAANDTVGPAVVRVDTRERVDGKPRGGTGSGGRRPSCSASRGRPASRREGRTRQGWPRRSPHRRRAPHAVERGQFADQSSRPRPAGAWARSKRERSVGHPSTIAIERRSSAPGRAPSRT